MWASRWPRSTRRSAAYRLKVSHSISMDVRSVLIAASSADPNVRNPAEQQIEAAQASNLVRVLCSAQPSLRRAY